MARTNIGGDLLRDGDIFDVDINSAAAIAGTKVSPAFGSQNVSATGHLTLAGTSAPSGQSGAGRIYFDSAANKIRVSENNGSFVDLIGSSVNGTGSNGRLSFWTGTNTIGSDANLFWDDSNNRLGIGTSTPLDAIDLRYAGLTMYSGGDNHIYLGQSATAGQYAIFDWNAAAGRLTITPQAVSNLLTLSNSGNVGIGTATALGKLHVAGSVLVDNDMSFMSRDSGGTSRQVLRLTSGNIVNVGDVAGGYDLRLNAGGGYAYLSSAGSLGIGTAAPESRLDVSTTSAQWARFGDAAWSVRIGQQASGNQWIGMGVNKTAADNIWRARTADTPTVAHSIMELPHTGGFDFYAQAHQTDGTALSPTLIMHLGVDGKVGIATASPASSAIMEISSTSKGFLPPRMASPSGAIASPTAGVMAYNTTVNAYQFYNGTAWVGMGGASSGDIDKIITSYANGDVMASFVTGNLMYLQ